VGGVRSPRRVVTATGPTPGCVVNYRVRRVDSRAKQFHRCLSREETAPGLRAQYRARWRHRDRPRRGVICAALGQTPTQSWVTSSAIERPYSPATTCGAPSLSMTRRLQSSTVTRVPSIRGVPDWVRSSRTIIARLHPGSPSVTKNRTGEHCRTGRASDDRQPDNSSRLQAGAERRRQTGVANQRETRRTVPEALDKADI